jgi:hypothetical protein
MYALLEAAREGVHDTLQHVTWNGVDFSTDGSLQLLNRVQTIGKDFFFQVPPQEVVWNC